MKAEQRGISHREVITNPDPREMKRPKRRRGMRMKPRMKGWNPDRDKRRFKSEKLFVMLVLEICNASRLISFLNFYTRVSMEHSRMEQIHTLFAAKY